MTEMVTASVTEPETDTAPPSYLEQGVTDPPPTEARLVKTTELAQRVAAAVNAQRQAAGLDPLTIDAQLCGIADCRALEQTVLLGPTRPDGSGWRTALGSHSYAFAAELRYYGSGMSIVDRWMRIDAHRKDILSDAASVIGAAAYAAGDMIYVVVILAG